MNETWKIGDLFQIRNTYWRESVFVVTNVHENSFFDKNDYQKKENCDWYYHTWYRQRIYEDWIKI